MTILLFLFPKWWSKSIGYYSKFIQQDVISCKLTRCFRGFNCSSSYEVSAPQQPESLHPVVHMLACVIGIISNGRTDGWTDGQTDGRTEWNQNTPQQLHCVGGIINTLSFRYNAFENVVYKMTGHFVPSSMRAFIWCLFDNIGFHLLMVLPHSPMISGKRENDETK